MWNVKRTFRWEARDWYTRYHADDSISKQVFYVFQTLTFANRQGGGGKQSESFSRETRREKIEFQWNNVSQEIKVLNSFRFAIKMLALFRTAVRTEYSQVWEIAQHRYFTFIYPVKHIFSPPFHSLVTIRYFHLKHIKMLLAAMRKLLYNNSCSNICRCNLCRFSFAQRKKCTFQTNGLHLHTLHEMFKPELRSSRNNSKVQMVL